MLIAYGSEKDIAKVVQAVSDEFPDLSQLQGFRWMCGSDWGAAEIGPNALIWFRGPHFHETSSQRVLDVYDSLCSSFAQDFSPTSAVSFAQHLFSNKAVKKYDMEGALRKPPRKRKMQSSGTQTLEEERSSGPNYLEAAKKSKLVPTTWAPDPLSDEIAELCCGSEKAVFMASLLQHKARTHEPGLLWMAGLDKVPRSLSCNTLPGHARGGVFVCSVNGGQTMFRELSPLEILKMKLWPHDATNLSLVSPALRVSLALNATVMPPTVAMLIASLVSMAV